MPRAGDAYLRGALPVSHNPAKRISFQADKLKPPLLPCIVQLTDAFHTFGGELVGVDWASPQAIRTAITAAGKLVGRIGAWAASAIEYLTALDLGDQRQFVRELVHLLAFGELQEAWHTFNTGWAELDWSHPLTAIPAAWSLVFNFGRDILHWVQGLIVNILGLVLPDFFAIEQLKTVWSRFTTGWEALNWSNPLTAIPAAGKLAVNLFLDLAGVVSQVLQNLTGIELPDWFAIGDLRAVLTTFTTAWDDIEWDSLSALWQGFCAFVQLVRGVLHWGVTVFKNFTGIDLEVFVAAFEFDTLIDCFRTCATTLSGIDWSNPGAALMTAVGAVVQLVKDLGSWALNAIHNLIGWEVDVVRTMFASFEKFIETLIKYWFGADGLAAWKGFLAIFGGAEATLMDAIRKFSSFFNNLPTFNTLPDWIRDNVLAPFIGQLTGNPLKLDFGALGVWARSLLTKFTPVPAEQLIGKINPALLSKISVSSISAAIENLLTHGLFDLPNALHPDALLQGWNTAVKSVTVALDGTLKQLFGQQAIPVHAGDRMVLETPAFSTTGFSGSGSPLQLGIIPWKKVGDAYAAQPTVTVASIGASATPAPLAGPEYVVPADIDYVTPVLTATAGALAGVAKFAGVSLTKVGALSDELVERLREAWTGFYNKVFGATGFNLSVDYFLSATDGFLYNLNTAAYNAVTAIGQAGTALTDAAAAAAAAATADGKASGGLDAIVTGFAGWDGFGFLASDAARAAAATRDSIADLNTAVANLQAAGHATVFVDFTSRPDASSLGSSFTQQNSGSGSGSYGISSGRARPVGSGSGEARTSLNLYNAAASTGDHQMIGITAGTSPGVDQFGNKAFDYILGRSDAAMNNLVFARLVADSCAIGYRSAGGALNNLASTSSFSFDAGAQYWLECTDNGFNPVYNLFKGNALVFSVIDTGLVTHVGASYRYAGFGGFTVSNPFTIAAASRVATFTLFS